MLAQRGKMGEHSRKRVFDLLMQDRRKTLARQELDAPALIEEQTQLGNETNIRESEAIADQIFLIRR